MKFTFTAISAAALACIANGITIRQATTDFHDDADDHCLETVIAFEQHVWTSIDYNIIQGFRTAFPDMIRSTVLDALNESGEGQRDLVYERLEKLHKMTEIYMTTHADYIFNNFASAMSAMAVQEAFEAFQSETHEDFQQSYSGLVQQMHEEMNSFSHSLYDEFSYVEEKYQDIEDGLMADLSEANIDYDDMEDFAERVASHQYGDEDYYDEDYYGEDATDYHGEDATDYHGEDATDYHGEDATDYHGEDATDYQGEDATTDYYEGFSHDGPSSDEIVDGVHGAIGALHDLSEANEEGWSMVLDDCFSAVIAHLDSLASWDHDTLDAAMSDLYELGDDTAEALAQESMLAGFDFLDDLYAIYEELDLSTESAREAVQQWHDEQTAIHDM